MPPILYLHNNYYNYSLHCVHTDPPASGQRKRSLSSDKEAETLSKRPKNDVTVQGMIYHYSSGFRI